MLRMTDELYPFVVEAIIKPVERKPGAVYSRAVDKQFIIIFGNKHDLKLNFAYKSIVILYNTIYR